MFHRHDISRLPTIAIETSAKKPFRAYPVGYLHVDLAEVRTEEGKLDMLLAIDRTGKVASAELHERVSRKTAADFLQRLIEAVPYRVHAVLTDHSTHFTTPGNGCSAVKDIRALEAGAIVWAHSFELACAKAEVDHRPSKPFHPWTIGQAERMNGRIEDATLRAYQSESHDQRRDHLAAFVAAYNLTRRLKRSEASRPSTPSVRCG